MIAMDLEAFALKSIALNSVALKNNNRSLIDKRVTGVTCHAGFHGAPLPGPQAPAPRPERSPNTFPSTHDR